MAGDTPTEDLIQQREDAQGKATAEFKDIKVEAKTSPTVYYYPSDLHTEKPSGGARYPHSVIFYINARSNSRIGQSAINSNQANQAFADAQNRLTEEYTAQNRIKSEQYNEIAAAAGFAIGFAGTVKASKQLASGDVKSGLVTLAEGLVGGTTVGVVGNEIADVSTQVRLLSAIELVTQTPPIAGYAASYDQEDVGSLAAFAGGEDQFKQILQDGKSATVELLGRGAIKAASSPLDALGLNVNVGAGIQAASKKVANPYREQLFQNMEFRKHQFSYQFAPKNKAEHEQVMEIIQLFKYHMHPELSPDRLFLIYPSEFQIEYRYNTEQDQQAAAAAGFAKTNRNTYLSKIGSCVLENMKVTYGNQDFITIKGTEGAPAFINLELSFAETEILTNNRIGQNYKDSF